jgi:hypothetical protein
MSASISELKSQFMTFHDKASEYFQDELRLAKEKVQEVELEARKGERRPSEIFKVERQYWSYMSLQEQERGEALVQELVEIMSNIATVVKHSPLLDEADQREIVAYTKTMRSAVYFRRYLYSAPEAIHDDGIVLGVRPAEQSEDDTDIDTAQKIFKAAHSSTVRILDLIIQGSAELSSFPLRQPQVVSKYRPNTALIMMWMDSDHPELDDVSDAIKSTFETFGIDAKRGDDIEHEGTITQRILDEIATSEFLIADLTGARPSVYYEVGYAHALGKRVILYRKRGTELHFDLAVHNCPEYENLGDLKNKLKRRLGALTNKTPS